MELGLILAVAGALSLGAGVGMMVNHLFVSRVLMHKIERLRYAGFMGDPPPMPPEPERPFVRED